MKKILILILIILSTSCASRKDLIEIKKELSSLKDSLSYLNEDIKNKNLLIGTSNRPKTENLHIATYIGAGAGENNDRGESVFIGNNAGRNSTDQNSVFIGVNTGYFSKGYGNVVIGNYSGGGLIGQNNVIVGKSAQVKKGDNNIIIGTHAGREHGSFSNKLIIESSESTKPLIYGDFEKDIITFNAITTINGYLNLKPLNIPPKKPEIGCIYFDSKSKKIKYWNGENWTIIE